MIRTRVHFFLVAVLVCGGCATEAKSNPKAMIAQLNVNAPVHKSLSDVNVTVVGGEEASVMILARIADEDFAEALRESIMQSGLFRKALEKGLATYQLHAFIAQINRPIFGASSPVIVSMEVNYTLARTNPKEVLWQKAVVSTYTAPSLQLAKEGAARKNIEQAIQEMSQLRLE